MGRRWLHRWAHYYMPEEAHCLQEGCQHSLVMMGLLHRQRWDLLGTCVEVEAVEKGLEKGLALMPWPEVAPAESLTGCA